MRLTKFNKNENMIKLKAKKNFGEYVKRNGIKVSIIILLFAVIYFSFSLFQSNSGELLITDAKVGDFSSDFKIISYKYDDGSGTVEVHSEPPAKESGYMIDKINCENADGSWDKYEWGLKVTNITGKVKCNLIFKQDDTLYSNVQIGDFVKMTPTKTSYTISPSESGMVDYPISTYTSDKYKKMQSSGQTINPSLLKDWLVIDKNSNGVEMVSYYMLYDVNFEAIMLYGQKGYKNSVDVLENAAAQFASSYTSKTRYFGYNGQTKKITQTLSASSQLSTTPSIIFGGTGAEYNGGLGGDNLASVDYTKLYNALKKINKIATTTDTMRAYLVGDASTYAFYYSASRKYTSGSGWMVDGGLLNMYGVGYSGSGEYIETFNSAGLRIVVTIDPSVKIASGDGGSMDSAYTLKK